MVKEKKEADKLHKEPEIQHKKVENPASTEQVQESKPQKSYSRYYIVGSVLIVLAVAVIFFQMQGKQEDVAAVVNGKIISIDELNKVYESVPEQYKAFVNKGTILDQLIERTILTQEAEKNGIKASVDEAKDALDKIKESQGMTDEQFQELLTQNKVTEDEIINQYLEQITIQKYINETLLENIVVTDEEIGSYYNENIEQFDIPEQATVRHILIGDVDLSAEEREAKAKSLLKNITKDNFCEYVEQYSTDTASVPDCGEYTFGEADSYVQEFKDFAFKNSKGKIGAVNTQYGTHIMFIVSKEKAKTLTLEEAREQIETTIKAAKAQEDYTVLYKELKDNSEIKIVYLADETETQDLNTQAVQIASS